MCRFLILLAVWACFPASVPANPDLGRGRCGDVLYIHHPPDPVNVRNGNFYLPVQDYYLPCFGFPLEVYRSYNSVSSRNGLFGKGWTFNYDIQIVVGDEKGMRIVEADGYVNEYVPVEDDAENRAEIIDTIVTAKKNEDIQYAGNPKGKGDTFYADYRKKLQGDKAFFERQKDRYLPKKSEQAKSGKYISRKRGTTYIEKLKKGYIRTTDTGRQEDYSDKGLLMRISDRNGNALAFSYNSESRLERVNDDCGQWLRLSYNKKGKIAQVLDSIGRKLSYTYDDLDHLVSAVSVDGETAKFVYDKSDRMTALFFGDGGKTEIVYDPKTSYVIKQVGPGTKITEYKYGKERGTIWADVKDNEGGKNRYEYVDSENKIVFVDKDGKKTTTTVTACCGKPLTIRDDAGIREEFRYDDKGNLISKTDALKKTMTFTYETRFNLPSQIKEHDGSTMNFRYDKSGNLSFASGSDGRHIKLLYEKHGKIEKMTDHQDNSIAFEYNYSGKPTLIEKTTKATRVGAIRITYDNTGEMVKVDYEPKSPEIVQNIKDTLASFLRLLKPTGIDFEI